MKKVIKRASAAVMTAALAMSMVACGGSNNAEMSYTAGTYSAKVTGMHEMTINVTFDEKSITDIKVEHEETEGIGVPVVEDFTAKILEGQGLGLDVVAGATLTSNAIIDGVADCVKQAGGDVEALKAIKP